MFQRIIESAEKSTRKIVVSRRRFLVSAAKVALITGGALAFFPGRAYADGAVPRDEPCWCLDHACVDCDDGIHQKCCLISQKCHCTQQNGCQCV